MPVVDMVSAANELPWWWLGIPQGPYLHEPYLVLSCRHSEHKVASFTIEPEHQLPGKWGLQFPQPKFQSFSGVQLQNAYFLIQTLEQDGKSKRSCTIIYRQVLTKPISSVPLFFPCAIFVKTNISYWISRLYFAGAAAALLQWQLSKMNVTQGIQRVLLQDWKFCLPRN